MAYDVATLEKKYKVALGARLKKFVSSKEYAKYKGAKLRKPIDDELSEYDTIVFGSASLFDTNMFDKKCHPGFVPLAALADKNGSWRFQLFVANAADGSVHFGRAAADPDEDQSLRKVASNLDAFLKLLKA
jgi:hypothetical protein